MTICMVWQWCTFDIVARQIEIIGGPAHQLPLVIVSKSSEKLLTVSVGALIVESEFNALHRSVTQEVSLDAGPSGFAFGAAFEELDFNLGRTFDKAELRLDARAGRKTFVLSWQIEADFTA